MLVNKLIFNIKNKECRAAATLNVILCKTLIIIFNYLIFKYINYETFLSAAAAAAAARW